MDAAADYAVNGPVVLALEGIETTQISVDSYLQIPANGLITNESTISEDPELVAGMVRATQRAIAFTVANPDEAFAISLDFVPEAGGDNETTNRAIFDAALAYWSARPDLPAGQTTLAEWQNVADLMQRIKLVDTPVEAETLYTNQFVMDE